MLLDEERFNRAFASLVAVADDILGRAYKDKIPHGVQGFRYEVNNDGGMTGSGIYKIDYRVALLTVDKQLKSTREYIEVSQIVSEIPVFQGEDDACWITSEGAGWRLTLEELIFLSLQAVIEKEEEDNNAGINRVCRQIEDYFSDNPVGQDAIVVLENIKLESGQFEPILDVTMRNVSPSEKAEMLNEMPILDHIYGYPITGPYYPIRDIMSVVSFKINVNKSIIRYEEMKEPGISMPPDPPPQMPPLAVSRVLDSIRLCANQEVGVSPVILGRRSNPVQVVYVLSDRYDRTKLPKPKAVLGKGDEEQVIRLCRFLTKLGEEDKSLRIALGRLRSLGDRETNEDRLLDMFTGIERIMGPIMAVTNVTFENRFRLSVTVAKYLQQTRPDEKDTYDSMMMAYGLRSSVAHGSSVSPSEFDSITWLSGLYKDLLKRYIADRSAGRTPDILTMLFP